MRIRLSLVAACMARVAGVILLGVSSTPAAFAGSGFVREELRIPMAAAGPSGLETLLVEPEGKGPFPLVIINHGSPRDGGERPLMSPAELNYELVAFARRGFVAVAAMRRGFGNSPGGFAEDIGACNRPHYPAAAAAAAADLRAVIAYLSKRPDVDAKRILSVGVSAGGFATVALTADPPPGLVAAISFAGGRGSQSPDTVCAEDELVSTFGALGARSRVSMLWVYAQNDHFFGPDSAERFRKAFVSGGGKVTFIKAPVFGEEGHSLFSAAGAKIWEPMVDDFLRAQGLARAAGILPPPALPDVAPPRDLSRNGQDAFRSYLASAPHKAFAMSPSGGYGWRTARRSDEEAKVEALAKCNANAEIACRVVMINDVPAPK
jgi:dienelactone hydrolase